MEEASTSDGPHPTTALPQRVVVNWEGGRRYRAGREGAPSILLDGDRKDGPGSVDAVISGLAACSAIDVVDILEKRRTPVAALQVDVRYSRVDGIPRRLEHVHLVYRVKTASAPHHVERAVELSREKYCSVSASLAPEVRITTEVEVEEP